MKSVFSAALLMAGWASAAGAMNVTVYNNDLGLIKERRRLTLKNGVNELRVDDVAARIDPTSVHFKSLTSPEGVSIIEQNFQYDLISQQKLLDKYLGREIELERIMGMGGDKKETIRGTLLSNDGGRVLQVGGKLYVNPAGSAVLPELPEGLQTKPTLVWRLNADKGGGHDVEISYLTEGLNWRADYVLVTSPQDDKMDLKAWVTIDNNSGATYKDARLKLVAGDVNRAAAAAGGRARRKAMMELSMAADAAPQFSEKAFFEYHLYTLSRPTTVREKETKQIELTAAADVPLKKIFIYDGVQGIDWLNFNEFQRVDPNYGASGHKKVVVMLDFKNSKENSLGIPLPQGRLRVYKKDTDGALEFIGEDSIDHTPKNENVRIRMGNAFDIVGERKRTVFQSDAKARRFEETFEIKLRNQKDSAVSVKVVEHLYRWSNWKIAQASRQWAKKDAQTVEFDVPVEAGGEAVVTYTVKYAW